MQIDKLIAAVIGIALTLKAGPPVSFNTPQVFNAGDSPAAVAAGDFNGDGNQDLAVVNSTTYTVSILLANGDGTFAKRTVYDTGNAAAVWRRFLGNLRSRGLGPNINDYRGPHRLVQYRQHVLWIPLKWGTDSGDVGQHRSGATLVKAMISEVPHLSQGFCCW